MPLVKGKSDAAFKTNVGILMGEIGKSPHVQSRAQALAIAYSKKRTGKQYGGAVGKAEGGWLDFLRPKPKVPPPEPVVSALKQDPPSKEFPDESDTFFSKYAGRTYGDPVEGYTNPGKSYVRDILSSGVKAWNSSPMGGGVQRLTSPDDAESIHRQWIAAERSPVAKLGFQPGKMMQTPKAGLNVGGLYDPGTDQSWYDTTNPDHAVHESMHRGIYMLRRAGLLPKELPSDEMLVRGLMLRHLGDIELGRGDAGDAQIKRARATVKPEILDAVEAAAADYVAQKRPGGPRSTGGAVMNPWMAAGGEVMSDESPFALIPDQQYAMMKKQDVIQGRLPRGESATGSTPEILPPSRGITSQSKDLDWTKPLLDIGFHPRQLANMTPEQIAEAGIKVVQTRLGPMAKPLRELGYTPQEMINMTPKDAYQAIFKNKNVINRAAGGAAISPRVATAPWYQRNAMRKGATQGMLGGASPGRVDNLPIKVKSGSYVVPADIVSAIGQGSSQAGAKMLSQSKMFSGSKMNKYGGGNFRMTGVSGLKRGMFAEGGEVDDISNASALGEQNPIISAMSTAAKSRAESKDVPIIAASGEFVLDPAQVMAFGDGDMKRGHDALDKWVLWWRKRAIKTLQKLKPPKAD